MALSDAEIDPYQNCSYHPPQFPNQDTTIALFFFFFFYAYIYNQGKKKKKKEDENMLKNQMDHLIK